MSPLPVIEAFDVVEDLGSRLLAASEAAMMNELVLQVAEEALPANAGVYGFAGALVHRDAGFGGMTWVRDRDA